MQDGSHLYGNFCSCDRRGGILPDRRNSNHIWQAVFSLVRSEGAIRFLSIAFNDRCCRNRVPGIDRLDPIGRDSAEAAMGFLRGAAACVYILDRDQGGQRKHKKLKKNVTYGIGSVLK